MRRLLPLLLLVQLGCGNVCDRMCGARADLIERCADSWQTSWEDLGYSDRAAYVDRCGAVWGDTLAGYDRDDARRAELSVECSADLDAAEADVDCETLLD